MIMQSDKAHVVFPISNIPLPVIAIGMGVPSVLIRDAMCVVNMVTKTLEMTNAMHLPKMFVAIVAEKSKTNCEEIRIVFYQYVSNSLEETTRDKRTAKTTPIHYHVHDGTEIRNVKSFLSHIKTKTELKKPHKEAYPILPLPRETTESLDYASYSDGG